jgi:hypothetical protein
MAGSSIITFIHHRHDELFAGKFLTPARSGGENEGDDLANVADLRRAASLASQPD